MEELEGRVKVRYASIKIDGYVDSRKSRRYSSHCGRHNDDMLFVANHKYSEDWLKTTKKLFATLAGSKEEAKLAVVCKAGVNRSVACSEIVGGVISLLGYDVEVVHLGKSTWQYKKVCSACDSCTSKKNTQMIDRIAREAFRVWHVCGSDSNLD